MHATNHVVERWLQRFPGESMREAFARSVPLPAGKLVAQGVKVRSGDEYHFDPISRAVFVKPAGKEAIVTVFKLKKMATKPFKK